MDVFDTALPLMRRAEELSRIVPALRRRVAELQRAVARSRVASSPMGGARPSSASAPGHFDRPQTRDEAEAERAARSLAEELHATQAELLESMRDAQVTLTALGRNAQAVEEDRRGVLDDAARLRHAASQVEVATAASDLATATAAAQGDATRRHRQLLDIQRAMQQLASAVNLATATGATAVTVATQSGFTLAGTGADSATLAASLSAASVRTQPDEPGGRLPRGSGAVRADLVAEAILVVRMRKMEPGGLGLDRDVFGGARSPGHRMGRWSLGSRRATSLAHAVVTGGMEWE